MTFFDRACSFGLPERSTDNSVPGVWPNFSINCCIVLGCVEGFFTDAVLRHLGHVRRVGSKMLCCSCWTHELFF